MTRSSFRLWLTSLLLGPTCALALEVGEIQVQSALNQLFDATIPLPTLTPEELGRVSVKVASPAMFEEFGLDRASTLGSLVFSIQYDAEGRVYVKVVSTQPIREPSLALLLEFGWPRGKTFREFTVLLDPVRRLTQRPTSRTKTVLNASEAPATEPSAPAPAVAAIAPVPDVREPAVAPLPVEAPSSASTYKPDHVYGPVAPGEGLWGIALKMRPEGVTREQMMQALFKTNPQAFSSAGIDGLKIGAMLRMPSYREIADFTGSAVAQRLAALEERPATPAAATNSALPRTPEVFPLALAPVPEPMAMTDLPAREPALTAPLTLNPSLALAPQPEIPQAPESVAPAPEPPPASETAKIPEPVAPEPVATAPEPPPASEAAKIPEPVAPAPEPPPASETAKIPEPVVNAPTSDSRFLEPVSVTPLLFLVVSEIMADAIQAPVVVASQQTVPAPSATESLIQAAAEQPLVEPAAPVSAEQTPVAEASGDKLLTPPVSAEELLVSAEEPPVSVEEPPVSAEEPLAEPPRPVSAEAPPSVEKPAPTEPGVMAAAQPEKLYQGGDEYGPVANNERLWDIASKVRPDPNIGRDVMMRALFQANPQAFSKSTIDHLKVGAMLRIPTLQEIVEYTGSPVARSLLEQQSPADREREK